MSDLGDTEAQDVLVAQGGGVARGVEVIRAALKTMPPGPGVYRMLDAKGDALYVGKARSLRNRVVNYTHPANLSNRLRRMVAETRSLEVVVTHTEVEALLLENNLIKRLMPRYNVLLRDDKSFPYIHLTGGHDFPQITKHRGARNAGGEYFGPFASAGAVTRTIVALQRAFLLRSCSDSIFASRTRPCLLYQIKRCSAPCVGRIDKEGYDRLVAEAKGFLTGRSKEVQEQLAQRMQELADGLDFESAAFVRDRIRALTHVQGRQDINHSTASPMPMSSPRIRRAAIPASRSSSSAPARTGATAPISRATTGRCRSRKCWRRSSASSTTTSRRPN